MNLIQEFLNNNRSSILLIYLWAFQSINPQTGVFLVFLALIFESTGEMAVFGMSRDYISCVFFTYISFCL